MLIQFSFKNFLSFKEEAVLDMRAVNAYKEHEYNLIDCKKNDKYLKVAAIYGANASGKSNVYKALSTFRLLIITSMNNNPDGENLPIMDYYMPFKFDKDKNNTEFEIILIIDEDEYTYGFEYNAEKIVEEWLFCRNRKTNRSRIIFERGKTINFGATVKKKCDKYKDQIPNEVLLISFFSKLEVDVPEFNILFSAILNMNIAGSDSFIKDYLDDRNFSPRTFINRILLNTIRSNKKELLEFLTAIDSGICDIEYKMEDNRLVFYTKHCDEKGEAYPLPLSRESDGTIKAVYIYLYVKQAIRGNRVFFVDELNTMFHPLLLKFIVDLFYEKGSTAQLIYTTHDTTLLDRKFFRRDQVWFVQKDDYGHSELSALSDFKVRSDSSFEKDYLAGVYGGIPHLKDFSMEEGD